MEKRIVIGVTGASGAIYARLLLEALARQPEGSVRIGLVMSDQAAHVWELECGNRSFEQLPFTRYQKYDFHAPFASGSARYEHMVVVPCSMGTLGRIAAGTSDDLMTRAADVVLKERRKLILVARETPLSLIHLRNMVAVTEAGAIVLPAVPSYYHNPTTVEEVAHTVVSRILDHLGISHSTQRWQEGS